MMANELNLSSQCNYVVKCDPLIYEQETLKLELGSYIASVTSTGVISGPGANNSRKMPIN